MKKLLAGLLAGIALGSTSVAGAVVASGYWTSPVFMGYKCQGTSTGALCKDSYGPYRVALLKSGITIYTGRSNPVAWCDRYGSPYEACKLAGG